MKRIIVALFVVSLFTLQQSCRKDDTNLDVDLSSYNPDTFVKGELDFWLEENMTEPYNIEVIYRFDRSMSDIAKNVSPPEVSKVQPTAEMILNGFLRVYEKVAGATFIKTYSPKQFVFFGSTIYNSNGSETLGTADAGRRITLYNLNTLDAGEYTNIKRRLRTIHHEFTHILNQLVVIPPTFEMVTPGDYTSDWTGTTEADAKNLGFISRYARDQYTEDFAETVAHLLVEGQLYYDRYANSAPTAARDKLKRKEAIVVDYFKQYFNIDFRQLQYEMYLALSQNYNDPTETVLNQLQNSYLKSITVDLKTGSHYSQFGKSMAFQAVWDDVVQKLALPINGTSGRVAQQMMFTFNGAKLILQAEYRTATGTTNTVAYYDFNVTYLANGNVKFAFVPNTTSETAYGNGRTTISGWQPLIDYLNNHEFVPAWIPSSAGLANFRKYAGFYVNDDVENYFYGTIVLN